MKKMKNDMPSSMNNTFEEEVKEDLLYDKKNVSDIIYINKDFFSGRRGILVFLAILFLIGFLITVCAGFGFMYNDPDNNLSKHYDLHVIHSNVNYGGKIDSFDKYISLEKAYSYSFVVENKNGVELSYKIHLINNSYSNVFDFSGLNYALFKDGRQVQMGNFKNGEKFALHNSSILGSDVDRYNLLIWSTEYNSNLDFRIQVSV